MNLTKKKTKRDRWVKIEYNGVPVTLIPVEETEEGITKETGIYKVWGRDVFVTWQESEVEATAVQPA